MINILKVIINMFIKFIAKKYFRNVDEFVLITICNIALEIILAIIKHKMK